MVNYLNDLTAYLKPYEQVTALYYWTPEECGNGYSKKVMNGWINRGMWKNGSSRQHTVLKTARGATPVEALAQFRGEELDAIGEIRSSQEGQGENIASSYDLSGRSVGRVSASLSKGIYLIGGKKVVRRVTRYGVACIACVALRVGVVARMWVFPPWRVPRRMTCI